DHRGQQSERKCQAGAIREAQSDDNAQGKTDENQRMPNPRNPSCKDRDPAWARTCHDYLSLAASNNAPAHFTKADSIAVALAPAGDGESVTVFDPFAHFAIGQS